MATSSFDATLYNIALVLEGCMIVVIVSKKFSVISR